MASTMQLEFTQAMSDFKTMFPEMDRDVIEAVLRANQGAVDATIDQLLAMSTDNQNEKLRNELDCPPVAATHSLINLSDDDGDARVTPTLIDTTDGRHARFSQPTNVQQPAAAAAANAALLNLSGGGSATGSPLLSHSNNTGASPKQRSAANTKTTLSSSSSNNTPSKRGSNRNCRWNPPLLQPLPNGFLRIAPPTLMAACSTTDGSTINRDFELPDEQFALMLQNEEFMNQLRWNQEFMNALEKEQQSGGKGRGDDEGDADFKERLKHMGKMSRKKFLQIARVFTWQRNKKTNTAKQIDSLPLKEEPSDDEDHHNHHTQQQQQSSQISQQTSSQHSQSQQQQMGRK